MKMNEIKCIAELREMKARVTLLKALLNSMGDAAKIITDHTLAELEDDFLHIQKHLNLAWHYLCLPEIGIDGISKGKLQHTAKKVPYYFNDYHLTDSFSSNRVTKSSLGHASWELVEIAAHTKSLIDEIGSTSLENGYDRGFQVLFGQLQQHLNLAWHYLAIGESNPWDAGFEEYLRLSYSIPNYKRCLEI
jgi:hypothetical protein